ncbi:Hypothetical protein SRAE_2000519450 [Strongyloides ratti]|uniref:Uncharacterized protein n=1 Tax=Strongyloides ratti TaxID=34506 RepID=A0A090LQV8_STRRB|nr:Hypothetical protein SRAE_2000519450 [Strongyloides ratti]CEF70566.1 Hypothetical protein SRAE_2000519450 [Strongyloides ratti]
MHIQKFGKIYNIFITTKIFYFRGLTKGIITFGIGVVMARTISQEFANPMP